MAGSSVSALSAMLQPNVKSPALDLMFRKTDFFDLLRSAGRISDLQGPSPHGWNVITGTNAAEVFTEGQAPPAAGRHTFTQATLHAWYVRGVCGETGHVRDNREKGGYYEDPFSIEKALLQADLFYKAEQELMGSTADRGLAAIVDSSGTYANISASTVTEWASEENGSVSTLTVDAMQTLYEELTSAAGGGSVPRGAMPTHVLAPTNQITNYVNTVGPVATTSLWRVNSGQTFDAGLTGAMPTFNGLPIVQCRAMTTTEMYMVDITDIELLIHRDLRVDPIPGNPELAADQLSAAFLTKVGKRNHHGKMTGITA
jgi:hypothetical protein